MISYTRLLIHLGEHVFECKFKPILSIEVRAKVNVYLVYGKH